MNIALATDHAGFEQLKELQTYLESLGHKCTNFGPKEFNPSDDYPDFIYPAAKAVASGECNRGIILGGSGQGETMVANRIKGVRCALFYGTAVPVQAIDAKGTESPDPYAILRLSRSHNDANILSLGARFLSSNDIKHAVEVWLGTPFSNDPRHVRRIVKIDKENS